MRVFRSGDLIELLLEILPVQLNKDDLGAVAQRAKLIINCIGPYYLYSTPVVEACALNGTHYLDV
jgi:short subunit dehydrogenase-like uncharacterized protein